MKFIVSILLTALIAFAMGLQLPWYSIAIAAFIVALCIPQKGGKAWLAGFLGVFLIWVLLALIQTKNGGENIATQMATIFPLQGNAVLLAIISATIGGLLGGFAALSGSFGRQLFKTSTTSKGI